MKYLFGIALVVALFEAASAVMLEGSAPTGRILAGAFAALMFLCAWAMWRRRSVVAASGIGVLLLADVGGTPFYERTSWVDWAIQSGLCAVGLLGVIAWVTVLRSHRQDVTALRV
jgi:hypothetical protein